MNIKVQLLDEKCMPTKATEGSAGFDLVAKLDTPVTLAPMERKLIPAGFCMELPPMYEAQIRSRSGLSIKHGVCVLNAPGTIDSDYRDEVKIIIINFGNEDYTVQPYIRIAQMVICKLDECELHAAEISKNSRGGFGSTGVF